MIRLLQGDVGSGKTIVAFEAIVIAVSNGYQAALMAPTEILAEQHFLNAKRILAPLNYRIAVVRRGIKKAEKQELLEKIASGEIQVIVGTHALLEERTLFKNLGMVIIDEQHRFGVVQRLQLMAKGENPNTLVMTATPIPRTLAMTLYGDLDLSVIDQMPPGRSPIRTVHVMGRDAEQSLCILMTPNRINDVARERIRAMVSSTDGFRLAEVDLQLRGPGEMAGTRQSGIPEFRVANLMTDGELLSLAQQEAQRWADRSEERGRLIEALSGRARLVTVG